MGEDFNDYARDRSDDDLRDALDGAEAYRANGSGSGANGMGDHDGLDFASVARWIGVTPPDIVFSIADLVPQGMVTLLAAEGGAGKSLWQQYALTCAALGRPCLGRATTPCVAAGAFAEDPDAVLHIRQIRINRALGVEMADLAGKLFIRSYCGEDARMWRDDRPTKFMGEVERQLGRIDGLGLIAIDNAALVYSGDESSRTEVTAFINHLNGVAGRLRSGIILSTHQSKSRTDNSIGFASGSTAWVNAARSGLELKTAEGETPPQLIVRKANHSKPGLTIALEWKDGVLTELGADPLKWTGNARMDLAIFRAIDAAWSRGDPLSLASQATGRYLPALVASEVRVKADDVKKRTVSWIASNHLLANAKVAETTRAAHGLKVAKWPDHLPREAT